MKHSTELIAERLGEPLLTQGHRYLGFVVVSVVVVVPPSRSVSVFV
jgi:hypothetical protein